MRPASDMPKTLKVLVVDDTLLFRLLVKDAVQKLPGFKVIDTAENGKVALEKLEKLAPDIVLSDIEMPIMNGLEFLDEVKRRRIQTPVLVISSITKAGSKTAMDALAKGAIDFITKPQNDSIDDSRAALVADLEAKLLPYRSKNRADRPHSTLVDRVYGEAPKQSPQTSGVATDLAAAKVDVRRQHVELITIGVSTGGPQALTTLLPKLDDNLPPIAIVQHMPATFITALAEKLDTLCRATVREAANRMPLQRGHIYIAPGGVQMRVAKSGTQLSAELRDDPAEHHCLPAADYLFRHAAGLMGKRTLGIVLTGMGGDGAQGLADIRKAGGFGIAQNEATCTVFGMPKQAIKLGGAQYALSLDEIAETLSVLTL